MASGGLIAGGIIVGGIGFFLIFFFSLLLAIIGLPLMLIGFIMFIVGLVSGGERVVYVPPYQVNPAAQQVSYQQPPQTANQRGISGYCRNCGSQLTIDSKFCPVCGTARI